MDEPTTRIGAAGIAPATATIADNEHVKALLSILQDNDKDASGIVAMLGYVASMENQLTKAVDELAAMRRELSGMREERNHPVRTALEKASRSLEATISESREMLVDLKEKIVEGCKNVVASFKANGTAALDGVAKFFRIKPSFEALRDTLLGDIKRDQAAIDKIGSLATQYHTVGMHLRNVGRAIRGRDTTVTIKPNGKLAKLASAPFRSEMKCLHSVLRDAQRAIAVLDRLDKAAPQKAAAERGEEKPSVKETMKRLQKQIDADRADAPAKATVRRKGAEL